MPGGHVMKSKGIFRALYEIIKTCLENIVMPTGVILLPSLIISLIIFAVSFVCNMFGLFYFISWPGAGIAVIVLAMLCWVERSEYREVSKLYGNVKLRVENIKRGQSKAGKQTKAKQSNANRAKNPTRNNG